MQLPFTGPAETSFLVGLLLSVIAGIILGAERELRGKDAGISTHALVTAGAMVFTFLSIAIEPSSPGRIAAQVVSGIGFLGAGLILKNHDGKHESVHNLTTAASMWFSAAIGMMFGAGFYVMGTIVTVVGTLIPRIPRIHPHEDDVAPGTH